MDVRLIPFVALAAIRVAISVLMGLFDSLMLGALLVGIGVCLVLQCMWKSRR